MTPWAEAKYKNAKPAFGPIKNQRRDSNDRFTDAFHPACEISSHPAPIEIIQLPTEVIMMFQYESPGAPHLHGWAPT